MKLLLFGVFFCVVLFFAGLIAPKRSRRLQRALDRKFRKAERKSGRSAGRAGDWTQNSIEKLRKAGDKSAHAGRTVREKLPP